MDTLNLFSSNQAQAISNNETTSVSPKAIIITTFVSDCLVKLTALSKTDRNPTETNPSFPEHYTVEGRRLWQGEFTPGTKLYSKMGSILKQ